MKNGDTRNGNLEHLNEAPVAEPSSLMSGALPDADLFNVADYADELDWIDISDDQAEEVLGALWRIMSAMVDLGLGVGSIHNLLPELGAISDRSGEAEVDLELDRLIGEFRDASTGENAVAASDGVAESEKE